MAQGSQKGDATARWGCLAVTGTTRGMLVDSDLLRDAIAPTRAALLVIDVQEDFVGPGGAAAGWGVDLAALEAPLRNIETLVAAARRKGVALAFARVITRPETDTEALKSLYRLGKRQADGMAICRAGTAGADYHRVRPGSGEIEIEKPLYSSFVGTDLDTQLRRRGIDTLAVAGFTTDCCVDSTVRDAFHRNYTTFVIADACAAYERDLHDGTIRALAKNCALVTETRAVVDAWS